ncbi:IS4 family transposase [Bradyrhizobium sp.]|uniref:IS4 family transposase n=1 Tax=Bradyrhizobium sp. TaxID=376 RepID=UPI0025C07654|nr:IS4 family transposase [Bradyrhizobium sp.]
MQEALVRRPGSCIRRLAQGDRARQMQFSRFLHNGAVTVTEMAETAAARTAVVVAGRDVLAIQDSSELVFGGKEARARGFGPIGRGGNLGGLLLHSVLAVDAVTGALFGLVDVKVHNRRGGKVAARRARSTADKESQRWLDGMFSASRVLHEAARITVVADRESDIYEEFARRPANVHLLTRIAQDRRIEAAVDGSTMLFAFSDRLPEQARFVVTIPAAPGRRERAAELALRYSTVAVRKPKNGAAPDLPNSIVLTLVDVTETSVPEQGEPIHWRLITTHTVDSPAKARMMLDFYRRRWIIEDYFRTLKTAGFDIEAAEIQDPDAMVRLVAAVAVTGVTVLQLVRARDGTTDQLLRDAFDPADQPLLETISATLEGKTQRQKNPHPKGTLAYAAWVIARLGAWDGYYGKPGPKVMRIGLQEFHSIKYGFQLGLRDV